MEHLALEAILINKRQLSEQKARLTQIEREGVSRRDREKGDRVSLIGSLRERVQEGPFIRVRQNKCKKRQIKVKGWKRLLESYREQ